MAAQHPLVAAVVSDEPASHDELAALGESDRRSVVGDLLESEAGRRWLRADSRLEGESADELLSYESDFRTSRRDRTLRVVVERATLPVLTQHVNAVAAGSAASALWDRLSSHPHLLIEQASTIVAGDDAQAAEATLHLVVVDPLNAFGISEVNRSTIATSALNSEAANVRGIAAEFLTAANPELLWSHLDQLITDDSQRVRGVAWVAALRVDRATTVERATEFLGNESVAVAHRRSALIALGTALPTAQMVEVLAYFVAHPDPELAADAADLMYQHHRHPIAANAAQHSPHDNVREIAERLLDPQHGSPAAGGSRPGDPTRSTTDIFEDMIRQLESKQGNQNDEPGR